jgi:hypothetical protein
MRKLQSENSQCRWSLKFTTEASLASIAAMGPSTLNQLTKDLLVTGTTQNFAPQVDDHPTSSMFQ